MIVWGGVVEGNTLANTGGIYDPASDTWRPISTENAPNPRSEHKAVWTGDSMIVWGGHGGSEKPFLDTGGRYNPAMDSWSQTALSNAPAPRVGHSVVWTGSEMIVLGGIGSSGLPVDVGGRYDPTTDTWRSTSTLPPTGRGSPAIWTGSHILVWGALIDDVFGTLIPAAVRYDPDSDTWSPLSLVNAPEAHLSPTGTCQ